MTPTIAITGVTGQLGSAVALKLSELNIPLVLLARTPSKVVNLPNSVVRQVSYGNSAEAIQALNGIKTLFMVSAAEDLARVEQHRTFIEAAVKAGVEHIIYTSFYNASATAEFHLARDHFATEEIIKGFNWKYTLIRNNFYMDGLESFGGDRRVIAGPAHNGKVSCISRSDIIKVIVKVIQNLDHHINKTYSLTGPCNYSLSEIASLITTISGNPITYKNETMEEAYESRSIYKVEKWVVDSWISTYVAMAKGECDGLSDDVEKITGEKPITYEVFLNSIYKK